MTPPVKRSAKRYSAGPFQPDPALVGRVHEWLERRDELAPLLAALAEELPAGAYRRSLRQLRRRIERGADAEELCRSRAQVATLMPLLAKDAAGDGQQLNRVLSDSLREDNRRRQRRRMLAYPLGVVALALVVAVFLSVTVVPVFEEIFNDFGLNLPWLTRTVLTWSRLFGADASAVRTVAVTVVPLGVVYFAWRYVLAGGLAVLEPIAPLVARGNSRSLANTAVFARRLAEGFAAQLPRPVALRTAGETSPAPRLRSAANRLADHDAQADAPLASHKASRWLPATMVCLLDQPDADHQATARRLNDYADTLAERVESRFSLSTGIIAQLSVAVVGGLVALVLLALLLPLVKLISGLT